MCVSIGCVWSRAYLHRIVAVAETQFNFKRDRSLMCESFNAYQTRNSLRRKIKNWFLSQSKVIEFCFFLFVILRIIRHNSFASRLMRWNSLSAGDSFESGMSLWKSKIKRRRVHRKWAVKFQSVKMKKSLCGVSGLSAECTWADKSVRRMEEWRVEFFLIHYLLHLYFMTPANWKKKNTNYQNIRNREKRIKRKGNLFGCCLLIAVVQKKTKEISQRRDETRRNHTKCLVLWNFSRSIDLSICLSSIPFRVLWKK